MMLDRLSMPRITTQRLLLRPIEQDDASDMYEYCKDDEVTNYLTFPSHKSLEDTKKTIERVFLERPARGQPESYAIFLRESNKMVGSIDLTFVGSRECAEMGYVIHKDFWNNGITTEAAKAIIDIGFTHFNLHRIQIRHHRSNVGSQRVIKKCGFVYEGVQREIRKDANGTYSDLLCYSMLDREYEAMKTKLLQVLC